MRIKKLKEEIEQKRRLIDHLFLITRNLCLHLDFKVGIQTNSDNKYIKICNIYNYVEPISEKEYKKIRFDHDIAILEKNRNKINEEISKIEAICNEK